MAKKVSVKEKKIILNLAFFIVFSTLTISLISAADVAYIYKSKPKIDQNVINVFNEMNLSVETINERNLTQNFSKYKFIFVGNERFKNFKKIPINEFPSVITNYYFGFQWGLTDNDGISKLAATGPLSVVKNGQIIQVYTQARYDNRPISLPYFYLGTLNKVPQMQKIAGTYSGDNFDLGDVISFAPAGTHLINGKNTNGSMCYYGIVESKYWTAEARQLFKDCVEKVALTCSQDSDCGSDIIGDNYCLSNGIYQNITHNSCLNPGTVQSRCVTNVIVNSVSNCTTNQTCQNSQCMNVHCRVDSDCGQNGFDDNTLICQDNNVFGNFTAFKCNYPNTPQSNCSSTTNFTIKENCPIECLGGMCIGARIHDIGFIDFTNSVNKIQLEFLNGTIINDLFAVLNCRTTIKGKVKILNKGNFTENATVNGNIGNISFNLNDITNLAPGDIAERSILSPYLNLTLASETYNLTFNTNAANDSNPSDNTAKRQIQINCPECNHDSDCEAGKHCLNNSCVTIICFNNSQCGQNRFIDGLFCQNNNVFQNFITFTCNYPGTPQSTCTNFTNPVLNQTCMQGQVCQNSHCFNVTCSSNSQCGTDGFVGNKFCQNNDSFQNFTEFLCNNHNTANSSCSSTTIPRLLQDCGNSQCLNGMCVNITCSNNSQCDDFNLYTVDQCNNAGTPSSYCSHTQLNCVTNNDCGITGFVGAEFCSGNSVFKNFQNSTCQNPATVFSYCDISLGPKLLTSCGSGTCQTGTCIASACVDNDHDTYDTCSPGQTGDDGRPVDCNDNNANVHPNALELCNGIDDDCDGIIDENNGNCGQSQVCQNGNCANVSCSSNSQCGQNRFIGNPFCIEGDVFASFISFTCNNPGAPNSFCSNTTSNQFKIHCPAGQACSNGVCNVITCINNAQCGIDGFVGNTFCQGNDVFGNYATFTCNNPGTAQSSCLNSTMPKLKQTCQFGCQNGNCIVSSCVDNDHDTYDTCSPGQTGDDGRPVDCNDNNANVHPNALELCNGIDDDCDGIIDENNGNCGQSQVCQNGNCVNVVCFNDNDCNDENQFTQDRCNNPGTIQSSCSHLPITCLGNTDCGQNSFINGLFCQSGDVFQNFITFTCNFAGTQNSFCTNSITPQLKTDCNSNQVCNNGNCANVVCFNDNDCNDENQFTHDKCLNPGTAQSICSHTPISCLTNLDCGQNGFIGGMFCQGNTVFQNFITFTCNNPGTDFSTCTSNIIPQLKQNCPSGQVCSSGNCVNVVCFNDNDCNDENQFTQDRCNNPGTIQSSCSHLPITCISNGDCGQNSFINGLFCQGGNVLQNFITFTCNSPGTSNSFCTNTIAPQLKTDCGFNQICSNGACIPVTCFNDNDCNDNNPNTVDKCLNPGTAQSTCTHTVIACSNNAQCGTDGFSGNPFCQNGNVFQNFVTFTCNNAGTAQSSCSSSSVPQLKQTCSFGQTCQNGACVNVACSNNAECGTDGFVGSPFCQGNNVFANFINFTCNNPGTAQSSCSSASVPLLKQTCSDGQTCSNGQCVGNVACSNNAECGTDGFVGSPFCINGDVFGGFITFICNNPGTQNSFCSNTTTNQLKIDCPASQTCSNGQCGLVTCFNDSDCNDNDPNTLDKCNNPGTSQSSCIHTVIVCFNNSQCGINNFTGDPFCQGNNVFQNFVTFTCNNPGTIQSSCSSSSFPQLKQTCSSAQTCSNGACQDQNNTCQESQNILNSIYSNINTANDFFTLDQARTSASCNGNDLLLAGAGTMAQCSDSSTLACNFNTNYEFNGPNGNGWQSFYSSEEQNRFYDTVREEAICLPNTADVSKYFSVYVRTAGSGADKLSLDQSNNIAICDAGDKIISGGGYAPICDASDPACGKKQYLEFNGATIVGNKEGWKTNYDLEGNEIYDTVQTFAICLKKTSLFNDKFKIYSNVNEGTSFYNLDQNRATVFCNSGDIAIGGGGNAAYCDHAGDPACGNTQYLEFNGKITIGNRQGWQTFFDLTGNQIYDTQRTNVICLGLSDNCIS